MPPIRLRIIDRRLWIGLWVDRPAELVWSVFTDTRLWPRWGPSITGVLVDGPNIVVHKGMRGRVRTVLGFSAPFEIDRVEAGKFWSWRIGPWTATGHEVHDDGPRASWIVFTVPLWGFFYVPVCLMAAWRISILVRRLPVGPNHAAPIKGNSFSMVKNTANSCAPTPSDVDG